LALEENKIEEKIKGEMVWPVGLTPSWIDSKKNYLYSFMFSFLSYASNVIQKSKHIQNMP
jgi:hypothetical protein